MKQSIVYIITDTHFAHEAIKEYCGRPEGFEEIIFQGLSNLEEKDLLIHLGDVCFKNPRVQHEKYIMPLKCKKWLIRGNHDFKSTSWYLRHGWDFVGRVLKDKYFGKRICFSHKPQYWDNWYDFNIHGHFHNVDHRSVEPEMLKRRNDRQKLLAIEYTNYQPVKLDTFLSMARTTNVPFK